MINSMLSSKKNGFLYSIAKLFIAIFFVIANDGCSTYGEQNLIDFNTKYNANFPISPKYQITQLSDEKYAITLHQGSVLLSPGTVRANFLTQAAETVSSDVCRKMGCTYAQLSLQQDGKNGWVHLAGDFTCIKKKNDISVTQEIIDTNLEEKQPATITVPLRKVSGVFSVPVTINNAITLDFLIDSGAADASIPADVVLTLVRTGTVLKSDFTGTRTYTLADGSTVPSSLFRIRSLQIGDTVLNNIIASVS